jgi:stress-induced morphogen
MNGEAIEARLREVFPDAELRLEDLTGGGDHWSATIVTAAFAGKSRIEQHQLVYAALGEAMAGPIHALQLRTSAPKS